MLRWFRWFIGLPPENKYASLDDLQRRYKGWDYATFCQHAPVEDVASLIHHMVKPRL